MVSPLQNDRRRFLQGLAAFAGAAAVGGCGDEDGPTETSTHALKPGSSTARYPLHVPPIVSASSQAIEAAPAVVDLGGGMLSAVLAYNALFPGPTLLAAYGDTANVTFTNALNDESTIHWHGMIVPTPADGHPQNAVPPMASYHYSFPVVQRACMNWYHPHPHMMTGEQVALGLAGGFIIRDAEEQALQLPSGAYEIPLIVRDANFDRAGNLIYNPKSFGYLGNTPLVNGTRSPKLDVEAAIYRFRVLNGCNARIFRLAMSDNAPFFLIGNDGGLLETSTQLAEILLGPAERVDILVDFRGKNVGEKVMLRCLDASWDLLELTITAPAQVGGALPSGPLSNIAKLSNPVRTRQFDFQGMSRINGREYDVWRIDFEVPFGETELWRFTTAGNAPHPVHVHGASFQLQSRTGGRATVFPWERGWKDTVLLLDGEEVEVLVRFDSYSGLYLMHCHKLEHEDMGMMANFVVA